MRDNMRSPIWSLLLAMLILGIALLASSCSATHYARHIEHGLISKKLSLTPQGRLAYEVLWETIDNPENNKPNEQDSLIHIIKSNILK